MKKDDLLGKLDIDITVSTAEDNAAKSQEISFMMQTLGQTMGPEMMYPILANWAEMTRQPQLAEQFRNYEPKPDPFQEQMKQVELEKAQLANKLLEAQIQGLYASSQEDMADKVEKIAKAHLIDAQTGKLLADTDLVNEKVDTESLRFLKEEQSTAHQEKMAEKEFDRLSNLDSLVMQKQLGDKVLGVLN